MNSRILIIILLCFCHCTNPTKKNNQNETSDFMNLVRNTDGLPLDFILLGVEKGRFHENDWGEDGKLRKNPLLNPLSDNEIKYIESKYDVSKRYNYHWIYKYEMKSSVLILMKQSDTVDVNNWLKLNLYNLKGELLDTLSFAGRKYGFFYMDGMFYKDMHIVTRSYHDIVEDSTDTRNFYATEITRKYQVEDTCFNLMEKKSERTLFTNIGEKRIYTRVDTLKFYY